MRHFPEIKTQLKDIGVLRLSPHPRTRDSVLHRCLGLLSPEHREALVLRFFEAMNYEDIAWATGSSVGTVRSRIHYGKKTFRKIWKGKTT